MSELGFSPYESRVYYALLQRSPMNGNEVGKQSGVPTSKVYETLERLRVKGAVRVYESDPVRYAPVPYRDLLTTFSERSPAMSCQTSTCASQSGPAPMPMVGIVRSWVTRLATSPGTISRTTANAPASATACASATTSSAASPRPWTR